MGVFAKAAAAAAVAAVVFMAAPARAYQYDETCDGEILVERFTDLAFTTPHADKFIPLPLGVSNSAVGQMNEDIAAASTITSTLATEPGYYKVTVRTFVCPGMTIQRKDVTAFTGS